MSPERGDSQSTFFYFDNGIRNIISEVMMSHVTIFNLKQPINMIGQTPKLKIHVERNRVYRHLVNKVK